MALLPAPAAAAVPSLPARIQAEDFAAYQDTTPGNLGGMYRPGEDVDIGNSFPDDGTYEVGWIVAGEWLEYEVQAGQTGDYVLRLRLAQHLPGGLFHVELDGVAVTPQLASPDTGTYRHWVTLSAALLHVTAGTHALRIVFDANGGSGGVMNLNWLELVPRALRAPGRIQAEDFDPGEGAGYHDGTPANVGDFYRRSEAVDVGGSFPDEDLGPTVAWIEAGEWLQYSVEVANAATYALRVRLAAESDGGSFHVEIDGANASGPIAVPNTSGYSSYVTLPVLAESLAAGPHTVRLVFDANGANGQVMSLNWFELVAANPVVLENEQPGTTAWQDQAELGGVNDITYDNSPVKGFASATSVDRGGSLTFYVHNDAALPVTMQVFRMGYYGGAHGRLMTTVTFPGGPQPLCGAGSNGQIECNWDASYTLAIPSSWTSGVYIAKLTARSFELGTAGNYVPFVVRDDARAADFLYVQPVTTYAAYNNYPSPNCCNLYQEPNGFCLAPLDPFLVGSVGPSRSLYGFNSNGGQRAYRVSFQRPHCGNGAGGGAGGGAYRNEVLGHELNLIAFLERRGYDVSYATSLDLHAASPSRLARHRAILSAGHDEYWSSAMRDTMEEVRDRGIDLDIFGSNVAYWQVRFEDGGRTMVSYKEEESPYPYDPIPHWQLKTDQFRNVGRPEQWLLGVQYYNRCCAPVDYYWPLENLASGSWVFSASPTPITPQTTIPLTLGHEVDSFSDYTAPSAGYPVFVFDGAPISGPIDPPRIDPGRQAVLAASSFIQPADPPCGLLGCQTTSIYQAPSGSWVFASGTFGWALSLANVGRYYQENEILKTATANVLNRDLADTPSEAFENLASAATISVQSADSLDWFAPENAIDGRRTSAFGTSMGYQSAFDVATSAWIELALPAPRTFANVILYPRNDAGRVGEGFPIDFTFQIWDGSAWVDWSSVSDYPLPGPTGQSFRFPPVTTDRLRINATLLRPVGGFFRRLVFAEIEIPALDQDGDRVSDDFDNCPTATNAGQADADADLVGDLCDSCTTVSNPRVAPGFLASNPWATLTGGQRDDDRDGFGNRCDGDFPGTSQGGNVGPADLAQFRASNGESRLGDTCGTNDARPCAIFDLDENTTAASNIGPADLARFRALLGTPAGPKCPSCPLACAMGADGSCN